MARPKHPSACWASRSQAALSRGWLALCARSRQTCASLSASFSAILRSRSGSPRRAVLSASLNGFSLFTLPIGLPIAALHQRIPSPTCCHQRWSVPACGAADVGTRLIHSSGCRDPTSRASIACSEGVIDQFLERYPGAGAFLLRVLHHDVDHVELGIDAEIGAAAAVPFQFAD